MSNLFPMLASNQENWVATDNTLPDEVQMQRVNISPMAAALAQHKPLKSNGPIDAVADLEELRATKMDYEKYDNDQDNSDENYHEFVEWLENLTSFELRQAKGNAEEQKRACCRYFKRGYRANLSTGELIDFLGVSDPSILDKAGYSDEESAGLFQISDSLTEQEITNTKL